MENSIIIRTAYCEKFLNGGVLALNDLLEVLEPFIGCGYT